MIQNMIIFLISLMKTFNKKNDFRPNTIIEYQNLKIMMKR